MKKLIFSFGFLLFLVFSIYAQLPEVAKFNIYSGVNNLLPDSLRPYSIDKGIRTLWVTNDLDKDGKPEVLITDYTNGGRVHVLELSSPSTLQLVWSSPQRVGTSSGSTPRWVRSGDLDGDGNGEIIFPLSTGSADFEVQVWEWDGTDNSYGTAPVMNLTKDFFASIGVGNFRTNREVASVFDFDGDGKDELIMSNRDHSVYILGVIGSFPGFSSWEVEGGNPLNTPVNSKNFSVSHWHSVPADIDGDGKKEIVNHMWNYWGFWSIDPNGPDNYIYPDTSKANFYVEFFRDLGEDAVSYMGIQPVDVDGNGTEEIAGILYIGTSPLNYALALISMSKSDTGLYIWKKEKASILGRGFWNAFGLKSGSFWGIGAADLNGNGRQEILLGGSNGFNTVAIEYKGTGSLLDSSSYTATVIDEGIKPFQNASYKIYDSLGVRKDTVQGDAPFVAKMFAGCDINKNGKQEVITSYQSTADSISFSFYHWDTGTSQYVLDSSYKIKNISQIGIRVIESTTTGFDLKELTIITPDNYELYQNYPNPFNPTTEISFYLPIADKISLKVYNQLGQEVKTLISDKEIINGKHSVIWDATNDLGGKVASGLYIAQLKFGNFNKEIKMMMIK